MAEKNNQQQIEFSFVFHEYNLPQIKIGDEERKILYLAHLTSLIERHKEQFPKDVEKLIQHIVENPIVLKPLLKPNLQLHLMLSDFIEIIPDASKNKVLDAIFKNFEIVVGMIEGETTLKKFGRYFNDYRNDIIKPYTNNPENLERIFDRKDTTKRVQYEFAQYFPESEIFQGEPTIGEIFAKVKKTYNDQKAKDKALAAEDSRDLNRGTTQYTGNVKMGFFNSEPDQTSPTISEVKADPRDASKEANNKTFEDTSPLSSIPK